MIADVSWMLIFIMFVQPNLGWLIDRINPWFLATFLLIMLSYRTILLAVESLLIRARHR